MKTKYWIFLLAGLLILLSVLSGILLLGGEAAQYARVYSQGKLVATLPLNADTTYTVTADTGTNVLTVTDGKIAVTQADCPDGYCMQRGFCNGGAQIVCLPNRLVIAFAGSNSVDTVVG